jgi:ribosomal protein S5
VSESIDDQAKRLGLNAPRVSEADLNENIVDIEIVKHEAKSGQILRWAVITTKSGFAVTGEPSASVSPANDRAELGEKYAIENAKKTLWRHMGYALHQKLAGL